LTHDIANIAVFLPRQVGWEILACVLIFLSAVLAYMFKSGGGRIQEIVSKKSSTSYVRSATIIDFVYAIILIVFKEWSNVPMSTTWVFVGLLCGRELAIATWYNRKIKRVFPIVAKDFLKVMMGLAVSVVMVLLVQAIK
jgi:phosphate/sulfate permease